MAELTGRALIAARCAKFFKDGEFVNLGIGLPLMCVNYLPEGVELWMEAEIGIVGCGASPSWDEADPDLIDAGGRPGRCWAPSRWTRRAASPTGPSQARWPRAWEGPWTCARA